MDIEDVKEEVRLPSSLRLWIEEHNEEALIADGFDGAIIGMCERFGTDPVVAYNKDRCIEILAQEIAEVDENHHNPDIYEEAEEYFSYNVAGSYMGENTPVFISFYPMEAEQDIKK